MFWHELNWFRHTRKQYPWNPVIKVAAIFCHATGSYRKTSRFSEHNCAIAKLWLNNFQKQKAVTFIGLTYGWKIYVAIGCTHSGRMMQMKAPYVICKSKEWMLSRICHVVLFRNSTSGVSCQLSQMEKDEHVANTSSLWLFTLFSNLPAGNCEVCVTMNELFKTGILK